MIAFNSNAMVDQMQFNEHTSAALTCSQQLAAFMQVATIYQDSEYGVAEYPTAGSLRDGRIPEHQMTLHAMQVRRITPVECERLQGFPDRWTAVPYRNKPAADGPRYKALGNSMAVPVMRWLGRRIEFALLRPWDNPEL